MQHKRAACKDLDFFRGCRANLSFKGAQNGRSRANLTCKSAQNCRSRASLSLEGAQNCPSRGNLTFKGAQNRRSRANLTFKGAQNRRSRANLTFKSCPKPPVQSQLQHDVPNLCFCWQAWYFQGFADFAEKPKTDEDRRIIALKMQQE